MVWDISTDHPRHPTTVATQHLDLFPDLHCSFEGLFASQMEGKQGDQSGYPQYGGYAAQPGYPAQPGYSAQPGYVVQPQQGYNYNHSTVVMTQPVTAVPVVNSVQDNMGLAIFTTICCCWPLGLFAIMRASESRTALATGDFQRAHTLSQESRRFSMFAIVGGCVSVVIIIIAVVVSVVVNRNTYYYNSY